jgi:hypothetical protein
MEDVLVVLVDRPATGARPFALFDGHGNGELPGVIAEKADGLEAACTAAFAQVQNDTQSWVEFLGEGPDSPRDDPKQSQSYAREVKLPACDQVPPRWEKIALPGSGRSS